MTPTSQPLTFRALLLFALSATPALTACSSSSDSPSRSLQIATEDVVREGDTSLAQLRTFLQRDARDWSWAGGQFDTPDDNATLAADTPPTFAWHADPADFAASEEPDDVLMTHLLVFSTPSNRDLLAVFSTLPTYTPDAERWQKLVDAGEPLTLSLTTGSFIGADLPEDGGPFIGQTLSLTIE